MKPLVELFPRCESSQALYRLYDTTMDRMVFLPDDLTRSDRNFLIYKACMPAVDCPKVPLLLLEDPYELERWQQDLFDNNHVLSLGSRLITPGHDLPVFEGEGTDLSLLQWENWDNEFRQAQLPGLQYLTCQYAATYFLTAYRDNPSKQVASRGFSMVSRWRVTEREAELRYGLGAETGHVTVLSDAIDGIGYHIAEDVRNGICNYSESTMQNIAHVTARGTTLHQYVEMQPAHGETVIKGVSIPGKLYDEKGRLKKSLSDRALVAIGLMPHQFKKPEPYKLYVDTKANYHDRVFTPGVVQEASRYGLPRYNTTLLEALKPIRKRILALPQPPYSNPLKELY